MKIPYLENYNLIVKSLAKHALLFEEVFLSISHWVFILVLNTVFSCTILAQTLPQGRQIFIVDSLNYHNELDSGFFIPEKYLGYQKAGGTEQALSNEFVSQFLMAEGDFTTQVPDVYWATFRIENKMSESAKLVLYAISDRTEVYGVHSNGDTTYQKTGFLLPVSEWSAMKQIPAIFNESTVFIEVEALSGADFYVRIGPNYVNGHTGPAVSIFTQQSFYQEDFQTINRHIQFQAVLQGMLLMILLFNFIVYINNRDLTYLFYSLYAVCISYYFLVVFGYDRLWLWGEDIAYQPIGLNLAVYGICIFYAFFSIHFLHNQGWNPHLKRILKYVIYVALGSAVFSSIVLLFRSRLADNGLFLMNQLFLPTGIFGIGTFLYVNVVYIRSVNKQAKYFAVAGFSLFIGVFLVFLTSMLQAFELVEALYLEFFFEIPAMYFFQVACLIQIFMFALALSYRSRLIENERTTLKEMDATKAKFFANISHEFKTPLTLILGPTANLLRKAEDHYSSQMLKTVQRNANRLLKLINEIMDLSKMDAGKMVLNSSKADIVAFVRQLTQHFQSYAEGKQIEVAFSTSREEQIIAFDKDKMEKALTNLFSNAFKFTPEAGKVSISISDEQMAGKEWVSVTISDTGIGIAENQVPHLFDRFYQASQKDYTTDQPSTGIGLALTKELVQIHQGVIDVKSTEGKGTVFNVRLPINLEETIDITERSIQVSQEIGETHQINGEKESDLPELLLIEDNSELRAYIRSCVESLCHVSEAENGEDGVNRAIESIPDLVITDVMMPKKDGFEVSRELKNNEKTNHIPIIILTGKSSHDSKMEGLETSADIYLSKPFDADELRLQIRNLLRNRERMQARYSQLLFLETTQQQVGSMEEEFLRKAIALVEENIGDEDFSVEQLSEGLLMDRTQLFRKLKALTDQNPSTFIRNLRLKRAKQMLEGNTATVSEIAFAVGFSSTSYFIKCFKEMFGESPGKINS